MHLICRWPNSNPLFNQIQKCVWRAGLLLMLACLHLQSNSQHTLAPKEKCVQTDLPTIIREWRHKPPKKSQLKRHSLLIIPSIGVNPSSGFMVGAAGQYVSRDRNPNSLYSFVQGNIFITTKKHLLFQVRSNVYTLNDKIYLAGDWRFLIFSQPTYGLSTRAPNGGSLQRHYNINGIYTKYDSLVQPMKFNHLRFYETVSRRIGKSRFYAGLGYHLDYFFGINDQRLDTSIGMLTSHYTYNTAFGFNTEKYAVSGVSINFSADKRDNIVNPSKGFYFDINWRLNPKFLGSSKGSNLLTAEWRNYINVSRVDKRKILGLWLMGSFSQGGKLPYLALPALGYDQRGKTGRGYTQGRFRGPNLLYAETEYRFPLSACGGIFGGVVFANFTSTDNAGSSIRLLDNVAPAVGCGLRIMVDKQSKSNFAIDFGVGRKSIGVYVGVSETF